METIQEPPLVRFSLFLLRSQLNHLDQDDRAVLSMEVIRTAQRVLRVRIYSGETLVLRFVVPEWIAQQVYRRFLLPKIRSYQKILAILAEHFSAEFGGGDLDQEEAVCIVVGA